MTTPSSEQTVPESVRAFIAAHGPITAIDTNIIGTVAHGVTLWVVSSRLHASNDATLDIVWRSFIHPHAAQQYARTRGKQLRKIIHRRKN